MGSGLRDRLLEVTTAMLAEQGLDGLSLREVARRADVSHGAPLRHFPSLAALLSEVAAEGFRCLEEAVDDTSACCGPADEHHAMARLAASGRAYVAFALAHPGVYQLMWRPDLIELDRAPLSNAAPAAFAALVRLVRAAQVEGWHAETDSLVLAGSLWGSMHGLVQLWQQRAISGPTATTSIESLVETTLTLALGDAPLDASFSEGPPPRRR
ncbi:MAG: TetR/AcrR family transcriptional regulator [Acidimicrobiales bacterium]